MRLQTLDEVLDAYAHGAPIDDPLADVFVYGANGTTVLCVSEVTTAVGYLPKDPEKEQSIANYLREQQPIVLSALQSAMHGVFEDNEELSQFDRTNRRIAGLISPQVLSLFKTLDLAAYSLKLLSRRMRPRFYFRLGRFSSAKIAMNYEGMVRVMTSVHTDLNERFGEDPILDDTQRLITSLRSLRQSYNNRAEIYRRLGDFSYPEAEFADHSLIEL
jgi:hypothetical protein